MKRGGIVVALVAGLCLGLVACGGSSSSKTTFTAPDGSFTIEYDPSWSQASADITPPGGVMWFLNAADAKNPTEASPGVVVNAEDLVGTTLDEDITKSLADLKLKLNSRKAITLGDGSPAVRVDATQDGGRLLDIITLDSSGTKTINASFAAPDDSAFDALAAKIEPYLLSVRKRK